MSERAEVLWAKLREGQPPVDESVTITSSDVNLASAAKANELWGSGLDAEESAFEIEMRENPDLMRAAIAELRRDERAATLERLRAAKEWAFDEGFTACAHQHMKQREDPSHPITRINPYMGEPE